MGSEPSGVSPGVGDVFGGSPSKRPKARSQWLYRSCTMRIPSALRTPGALIALVALLGILILFVVLAVRLPIPSGGLPSWSYWWFAGCALLWIWGIAYAIPRRFRRCAIAYATILTLLVLFATGSLAANAS